MDIRALEATDHDALVRFLQRIPEADRTFFKEDVDTLSSGHWMDAGPGRSIAVSDGEVLGWLAVTRLHGWSNHVGEIRLIVLPDNRGQGIGRRLAQRAILDAMALDLEKLMVEVIAVQVETIGMFRDLGFDPEALLADHVRDRSGELQDLMVLSLLLADQAGAMMLTGVADAL